MKSLAANGKKGRKNKSYNNGEGTIRKREEREGEIITDWKGNRRTRQE